MNELDRIKCLTLDGVSDVDQIAGVHSQDGFKEGLTILRGERHYGDSNNHDRFVHHHDNLIERQHRRQ